MFWVKRYLLTELIANDRGQLISKEHFRIVEGSDQARLRPTP